MNVNKINDDEYLIKLWLKHDDGHGEQLKAKVKMWRANGKTFNVILLGHKRIN